MVYYSIEKIIMINRKICCSILSLLLLSSCLKFFIRYPKVSKYSGFLIDTFRNDNKVDLFPLLFYSVIPEIFNQASKGFYWWKDPLPVVFIFLTFYFFIFLGVIGSSLPNIYLVWTQDSGFCRVWQSSPDG